MTREETVCVKGHMCESAYLRRKSEIAEALNASARAMTKDTHMLAEIFIELGMAYQAEVSDYAGDLDKAIDEMQSDAEHILWRLGGAS